MKLRSLKNFDWLTYSWIFPVGIFLFFPWKWLDSDGTGFSLDKLSDGVSYAKEVSFVTPEVSNVSASLGRPSYPNCQRCSSGIGLGVLGLDFGRPLSELGGQKIRIYALDEKYNNRYRGSTYEVYVSRLPTCEKKEMLLIGVGIGVQDFSIAERILNEAAWRYVCIFGRRSRWGEGSSQIDAVVIL